MFVVMKVLEMLLSPLELMLIALALALLLFRLGRGRLACRLVAACVAVQVLLAVLPWSDWLLLPLENRFPPPPMPERVDGIIVLGGVVDPEMSAARGQPSLNAAAERLTAMMELSRRYPEARVIFSGGSGSITRQELKEAPITRALLASIGADVDRVVFEGQSRNTRENAIFSRPLANPQPGETWLLVTSALHMPRAVGVFRAVSWPVTPYPVDYLTGGERSGPAFKVGAGVSNLRTALHEWGGMAYYRWRGWSDSWYPGL